MTLKERIDQLTAIEELRLKLCDKCKVDAQVYQMFLVGCGEYWKIEAVRNDGSFAYAKDFETADDLADHMMILIAGAMLANGEEV